MVSLVFLAVWHYLAEVVLVVVVAGLLTGFQRVFQRGYLRHWAASWWAFAGYQAAGAGSLALASLRFEHPLRTGLSALSLAASAMQLAWLLAGTWSVTRGSEIAPRRLRALFGAAVALGVLQALAFSWDPSAHTARQMVRVGGRQLLVVPCALLAAVWLWRAHARPRQAGRVALPFALVSWALAEAVAFVLLVSGRIATPAVFASQSLLHLMVHGLLAVAMVSWLLGEESAREAERAGLEAAVRRSETMAALGTLVSGVAHEVRNPLFGISSTVDALGTRLRDRADVQPHLAALRGEVERLSALMQDLLDYGRPTTQRVVRGSLREVVSAAAAATAELAARRKVSVDCRLEETLPQLPMDRRQMVQVFQNLIDNAIRHAPEGGTVRVRAVASARDGTREILCTVDDDGPGFAPGDEQRAFLPFFTRRRGGTGLGLSIVQRILEQYGGEVQAANRPGGGARLTVRLPLEPRL